MVCVSFLLNVFIHRVPGKSPGGYTTYTFKHNFRLYLICFTGKATAKLDPNSGQLLKTTRVLFWAKSRLYDLSEFHAVGIREVMIGSAMHNNLSSFYYIQFIGKNRVSLPPVSCNIKQAREQLEEIARVVNLPSNTDSEP